jgi:hypothetical protein
MEKLVSLAKRRGFIFQSSEIYGGTGSVWDYGPLGVELKKNIKDRWWNAMVRSRDDIEGLDAAILMHPRTWEASGHVAGFVDPLVIAALNTPSAEASTNRLGQVLRRLGAPGAARLFVARRGLGPDLVDPALAVLAAAGATYRPGSRLRAIQMQGGRATSLTFQENDVMLGEADRVILALPPWEAQRMLTGLPAPDAFAPIVNLHFAFQPGGQVRFLGLLGALCQWVLIRPEGVAVTISAGDAEAEQDVAELAPRAWAEILRAVRAFHVPGEWPEAPPPCRVIKERRATPRQRPGPIPTPPRRPLANLVLAGDWTWPHLPATIEAAICSGQAAAREALA